MTLAVVLRPPPNTHGDILVTDLCPPSLFSSCLCSPLFFSTVQCVFFPFVFCLISTHFSFLLFLVFLSSTVHLTHLSTTLPCPISLPLISTTVLFPVLVSLAFCLPLSPLLHLIHLLSHFLFPGERSNSQAEAQDRILLR